MLGYISDESVKVYARYGPEKGGFPAYIPSKNGHGWERKTRPVPGIQLFFYEEDILNWKATRKPKEQHREPVHYDEAERLYVLLEAMKFQDSQGRVHRTKLYKHLATLDSLYGFSVKTDKGYGKIRRYARTIDTFHMSVEELEVIHEAQKLIARNHQGDKVEARRLLLAEFGNAEEFSDAQWQWNTRTYSKLKQILDDAGIEDVKIKQKRKA
jgi:hypothetical protein